MTASIKKLLLDELLTELKSLTFAPESGDDTTALLPASIVFRKVSPSKPENDGWPQEDMPGIIISTPRMTSQEIEGGECSRDRWNYRFMMQIIDGDRSPDTNYGSYWKWQEQIVEKLNFQNMQNCIPANVGCLFMVVVTIIDDIDEKVWQRHPKFVSGVEAQCIVFKNRTNL